MTFAVKLKWTLKIDREIEREREREILKTNQQNLLYF